MTDLPTRLQSGAVTPADLDAAAECIRAQTEANAALRAQIVSLTAERDAAMRGAVRVKPLVWEEMYDETPSYWRTWDEITLRHYDADTEHEKRTYEKLRAASILAALEPDTDRDDALIRAAIEAASSRAREFVRENRGEWSNDETCGALEVCVAIAQMANLTPATIAAIRERAGKLGADAIKGMGE